MKYPSLLFLSLAKMKGNYEFYLELLRPIDFFKSVCENQNYMIIIWILHTFPGQWDKALV